MRKLYQSFQLNEAGEIVAIVTSKIPVEYDNQNKGRAFTLEEAPKGDFMAEKHTMDATGTITKVEAAEAAGEA